MKPTGRKVTLLVWPTGFPEGQKEPGAPEKPFLFVVPEYDYAEPLTEDEVASGYRPEQELGFKLSDIYEPLQTGVVERTQVAVGRKTWMWVDENGIMRRRPINEWATNLYWQGSTARFNPIVGTVAVEVVPGMLLHWPKSFGDYHLLETKELA